MHMRHISWTLKVLKYAHSSSEFAVEGVLSMDIINQIKLKNY